MHRDAPDCEWTKQDHSHTIGGELQTSVSTLEGCKQACLVDMQCSHGFDWDSNELKCYVSRNNDIRAGADGVFHYVCKSEWSNDRRISLFLIASYKKFYTIVKYLFFIFLLFFAESQRKGRKTPIEILPR